MTRRRLFNARKFSLVCGILLIATAAGQLFGQPSPAAVAGFDRYAASVEARLNQQHQSPTSFLAAVNAISLQHGNPVIEKMTPNNGNIAPGALIHDWRGTAFIPGATAAQFERLLENYSAYPRVFAPQVLQASILAQDGDRMKIRMRVRQHHVITVVLDTNYDVSFEQLDPKHRYSISRSTKISELDSNRRAIKPAAEHGFLWRMNTYWSYEERDGGLYVQIETVSMTRSIPTGLGWVVGPFVQSIPRESMEFTLRSASKAIRAEGAKQ